MKVNGKKLHLGCGKTTLKEWINLDIAEGQGVDIVADLEKCSEIPLPLEDHSIDEFYASHLIEHIHHTLPMMQKQFFAFHMDQVMMRMRILHM